MKRFKSSFLVFAIAAVVAFSAATPVMAAGFSKYDANVSGADTEYNVDTAGNAFIGGSDAKVSNGLLFGMFGAGKDVEVSASEIEENAIVAGYSMKFNDVNVGSSIFAAGFDIVVKDSNVGGNIIAAGNTIAIDSETTAKGVMAAGNEIIFDGTADALNLAGTKAVISGTVHGSATISADNVEIRDGAVIDGVLIVESKNEPVVSDGAAVGKLEYKKLVSEESDASASRGSGLFSSKIDGNESLGGKVVEKAKKAVYWIVAAAIMGIVMCWLFPKHLESAAIQIGKKTGSVIGFGILAIIATPVACLLLAITVIGAPVSALILILYVFLLCIGTAFAGASLGRLVFPKMNGILASMIGIAILEVAHVIPFLGILVGLAADVYTVGYVVLKISGKTVSKEEVLSED